MWYNGLNQISEVGSALPTLPRPLITRKDQLSVTTSDHTTTPLKRCTKCGGEFPATLEHFHKKRGGKFGLNAACKTCKCEVGARWRDEHPERAHESVRRWNKNNPEQKRKTDARWQKKHRVQVNANGHRRRARKRNLPATFTDTQAIAAMVYWQYRCVYCGVQLNQLSFFENPKTHLDHYVALSDPRPDNPGTAVENMLPTCGKCNDSKHNADPVEWITRKFGAKKAKKIIAAIEAYFRWVSKEGDK
jgi:hypothetical protein